MTNSALGSAYFAGDFDLLGSDSVVDSAAVVAEAKG